mmetsp:Transcript_18718/g.42888  ORF Transcript_18718/g.42888 Transcript_18718/m.42888 type:complete len:129 (-) Transcript_18718:7-393(-)
MKASMQRVLEVTAADKFVVGSNVPKKIDGERIGGMLYGRSRVQRVNGSFVTDVDWAAVVSSFRSKAKESARGREGRVSWEELLARAKEQQEAMLTRCSLVYAGNQRAQETRACSLGRLMGISAKTSTL